MMDLHRQIVDSVQQEPGLTARDIAKRVFGPEGYQQQVNSHLVALCERRVVVRRKDTPGAYRYYAVDRVEPESSNGPTVDEQPSSEDLVKQHIQVWLRKMGWKVVVKFGRERGIDIEASKKGEKWLIEVKGTASSSPMWNNYFLAVLGETLQRMDTPKAKYSVAFPEAGKFRRLWRQLPILAKSRTQISALFVSDVGDIDEDLPPPLARLSTPLGDEVDGLLRKRIDRTIRALNDGDLQVALANIRPIVDRCLDLIWQAELPAGLVEEAWLHDWSREVVADRFRISMRKMSRGRQLHLLSLMVGHKGRLQTRARFVSAPTHLLLDHLQSVGDFGQHLEGHSLSTEFVVNVCGSAVQLANSLTLDLQRS